MSTYDNDDTVEKLGIGDFLDEDFRGGGGGRFLDDWKEKEKDTHIDVWLNPKTDVLKFFRYEFPYVGKDKDGNPGLRWHRFNSMEPPKSMRNQYLRREDGTREFPATVDPMGRFIDWLCEEMSYEDTKIGWLDKIFEVGVGKKDTDSTVRRIFAGGATGDFDSRNLSKVQITEIYDATGTRQKDAYRQKLYARTNYLFQVVPNDDPGKTMFAIEPMGLVKKFQSCVAKLKEKYGDVKGDPTQTPMCFRWKHLPSNDDPKDKYDCLEMPGIDLTEEIRESFGNIGDVKTITGQSNVALLRKAMVDAWCHPTVTPPWDDIFGPAYEKLKGTEYLEMPDESGGARRRSREDDDEGSKKGALDERKVEEKKPEAASGGTQRRMRAPAPAPEKAPEPPKEEPKSPAPEQRTLATGDELGCDVCKRVMSDDEMECPSCGAEYVVKGEHVVIKHPVAAGTHALDAAGRYSPVAAEPKVEGATRARRRAPK